MKKLLTVAILLGLMCLAAPTQAKAEVRANIYVNPFGWFLPKPHITVVQPQVNTRRYKRSKYKHKKKCNKKYRYNYRNRFYKQKFNKRRAKYRSYKSIKARKYSNNRW